eukprot:scaffold9523_cov103-Cylindrotheca_fusiformis.AAC.9
MSLEAYFANLLQENNAEQFAIVRDDACSMEPSMQQTRRYLKSRNSPKVQKAARRFESEDSNVQVAAPKIPSRRQSFESLANFKPSSDNNRRSRKTPDSCPESPIGSRQILCRYDFAEYAIKAPASWWNCTMTWNVDKYNCTACLRKVKTDIGLLETAEEPQDRRLLLA